jgi:hypothetical protein
MTLVVFLEIKAEQQLIPMAVRYLSKPPVIPQQIDSAILGLCLKAI